MQTASARLTDALKNGHVLKAVPKLLMEWNQNRYAGILKVDNDPSDKSVGADLENFPIETIVGVQRPAKGIIKARTSPPGALPIFWSVEGRLVTGQEGYTTENYSDNPTAIRYYTVGPDSAYKYWTSPRPSTFTQRSDGSYGFPTGYEVRPYVLYKKTARSNKIIVTFESTWARPTSYDIQITTNGGSSWQTVSSNLPPDKNGQVIIYRQSNGSWGKTVNYNNVGTLNGLRLVVNGVNKAGAHLNLVEMGARLESDLSEFVTEYGTNFSLSEPNFITPIGKASSNTSSFSISNTDGLFNNDNPNSIYYQLIDKNILCTLDLEYDLSDFGGGAERVREFTMYVDQWSGESELELTAECKDSSKFFQEEKTPQMLLENITVGEAVWRICDSIGFNNFAYDRKATDPAGTLQYFWTETEKTVWDTLQELAEATQTAIYFDEFDTLRIKTREAAYDLAKTPVWNLEATNNGGKLADVEEAEIIADYEANVVNINYKDTKVSDDNKGLPQMHILWQPEETFVLRSSQLAETLTAAATVLRINPTEAATWPYKGMMNIEGELIKYDAKQYSYYNKSGSTTLAWVESHEDKINIDKTLTDEGQRFKSTWTGRMRIAERGVYWSSPRAHNVDINMWAGRRLAINSTGATAYQGGIGHNRNDSTLVLTSPRPYPPDSLYVCTRGNVTDQNYRRYGTRVRMPKVGAGGGAAGIVINSGDQDSGYYIELTKTETLDANGGAIRHFINEVSMFTRFAGSGAHVRVAGKGARAIIAPDVWYDLDVDFYVAADSAHHIVIYLNGIAMQRIRLSSGRVNPTGRFGMYLRSEGKAEFEYFFAHAGGEEYRTDEVSQFDKTRGGFVSGQWDREFVYGTRDANRRVGSKTVEYKQKINQYFFDEMGPIVHEIREMDVAFEKYPVLHSRLYMSNDRLVVPEYNATPFGAKFMLGNSSRDNEVGNGEDLIRFGADNPVDQKMMIYGRLIFQEEGQVYTAKNAAGTLENPFRDDDSIRKRGKVEVDVDSKWIQSRAEAERLGNWILKHWSGGNDEVNVTVFGNPLFQLGDVVTLDYPDKNMSRDTHKYFIVSAQNDFSQGLSTSLTLRRAKI